jgi:hypothetical protein
MPKKQKLIIELTPQQTKKYLEVAQAKTTAELKEDCLPSGSSIVIEITSFGNFASIGNVDLGDVKVDILDI